MADRDIPEEAVERVVGAMAKRLAELTDWDEATAWNFLYPPSGAFQAALEAGALFLSKEEKRALLHETERSFGSHLIPARRKLKESLKGDSSNAI